MAQRFGGKYSPGERPEGEGYPGVAPGRTVTAPEHPPHPLAKRPFWLLLAAAPLLLHAFGDGPVALARNIGAFALIGGAAWLIREGLKAEAAYDARRVARRPALPRKILGAVIYAIGLGLGARAPETGLAGQIVIALIGGALALAAFGPDPTRDKGMEGIDPFQQDRVAKVVAEGEKYLAAMREAIARAGDAALVARVETFAATARKLFRAVEEDPGDLAAARRYMGVYLEGARDATVKFADLFAQNRDAQARADYAALLDDLEANFTARTQSLIANGRDGLEVEIEVLRERLAREGLAPPKG
ncbi:MAG: 5-bromo-4-chloroindolyl phosphate hydrolysis family protein [Paenirhodobacter sp.]|uniref:5-bromo-4-chloroindolyl phosphate hydrolysis family protein n=1 Tax=Paenirhodobacter sp. TaxID=1965326 RepID=UPI003D13D56A